MATVNIPVVSLKVAEAVVADAAPANVTNADTGMTPANASLVLRITSGGVAGTVTVAASPFGGKALPIAVGASGSVYVRLPDTTSYAQSDGNIHLTTTQAVSVEALTRH